MFRFVSLGTDVSVFIANIIDYADHGGFHGDVNATYPVGKISDEDAELIATTKEATESAIAMCKPGVLYRDIGNKIESIVKPKGYGIVRQYTAHGINQLVRFSLQHV